MYKGGIIRVFHAGELLQLPVNGGLVENRIIHHIPVSAGMGRIGPGKHVIQAVTVRYHREVRRTGRRQVNGCGTDGM